MPSNCGDVFDVGAAIGAIGAIGASGASAPCAEYTPHAGNLSYSLRRGASPAAEGAAVAAGCRDGE
jgi:hypothetical protein